MTSEGKTLRTQFENLIDDEHDIEHTYQLFTLIKNIIENTVKPICLQNTYAGATANVGDTYESMKTVADDFRQMIKVMVGTLEYWPVSYANRILFKDAARRYYIDYKKMVADEACLALTGKVGSAQTISQIYMVKTDDLTEANEESSSIILWPDEFKPIIPFVAASIFLAGIDPDEISVRQAIANNQNASMLLDAFIAWDHDAKLQSMNNQGGYADTEEEIDIGSM